MTITENFIKDVNILFKTDHSVKTLNLYIQIFITIINAIIKSKTILSHTYNTINTLLIHFKTGEQIKSLFEKVTDYDKMIFVPYYNMESNDMPTTLTKTDYRVGKALIPLYYLYLRRIMCITGPNYKQKVEDALNILVSHDLHTTTLMQGSDYTLHVIPYLCKEYMDTTDSQLWSLGKLSSMISQHNPIEYPIYNHQTLIILRRGLELGNRAVVKLMMQYVYPEDRVEAKYAYILAARKPRWFKTLLDSIPYKPPEYVLYLNSNLPGRPAIRNVLPAHILTRLESPHNDNNTQQPQSPTASNTEEEQNNKNKPNNNDLIAAKYARPIARLSAKRGKSHHRMTKKSIN